MNKTMKHKIREDKSIRTMGISAVFALIILGTLTVFPLSTKSTPAEATPITSTTSIEITSSSTKASIEVIPASSNGTFATSSTEEEVAFSVTTNNLVGYTLSIVGSGDGTLVNTNDSSATLDSIDNVVDLDTFSNNTSSDYINKWGVKPSKLNSSANNDYLPAPTTSNTITIDTTSTANPTTANDYTIGLGARVNYEKPSGVYTNTFTLLATARPMMYEIIYSTGGISDVTGTVPAVESNTTAISGVTLANNTLSRSTYTFAGWCDGEINTTTEYDATTKTYYNPGTKCNGASAYDTTSPNADVYGATSTYSFKDKVISDSSNNQVTLTAVWRPTSFDEAYKAAGKSQVTYNSVSYYTMQTMASSICKSVSDNQTTTLLDNRLARYNNSSLKHFYTVAKINGNCWMTQNLTYGYNASNTASTNSHTFTVNASDTDISSNKSNWTIYNLTSTAEAKTYGGHCYVDSIASGGYTYPCAYYGSNSGTDGYTVWYNFAAATAGQITGTNNNNSVTQSVCPKNWTLPNLAIMNSIASNAGGVSNPYINIFKPVYGGQYQNGIFTYDEKFGFWWGAESTADTTTTNRPYVRGSIYTSLNYADKLFITSYFRNRGLPIRCVAR